MHVLMILGGDVERGDIDGLVIDVVVAVDSGLATAIELGLDVDEVVGDLDSVDLELVARVESAGTVVVRANPDKDASDFSIALQHSAIQCADEVTVVGLFGGRCDHELANIAVLANPEFESIKRRAVSGKTELYVVDNSSIELSHEPGTLVSLMPIGREARGVCTKGMLYRLEDAVLSPFSALGLSNEIKDRSAEISCAEGPLLVMVPGDRGVHVVGGTPGRLVTPPGH